MSSSKLSCLACYSGYRYPIHTRVLARGVWVWGTSGRRCTSAWVKEVAGGNQRYRNWCARALQVKGEPSMSLQLGGVCRVPCTAGKGSSRTPTALQASAGHASLMVTVVNPVAAGPSELLVGVPHTQGHPVTALPVGSALRLVQVPVINTTWPC